MRRREFMMLLGGWRGYPRRAQERVLPVAGFVYDGLPNGAVDVDFLRGLNETGGWKMMTKTKMVLAAALVLGATPEVSAKGGHGGVTRCSLAGVNTVHHGKIFGKRNLDAAREYGFVKLSDSGGKHGTWEVDPSVCGHT
jgi:hypothetical protein